MFKCISYTPVNKSTCLGVATIEVPRWGVEISGISLHQKDGKRWVNLPSRIKEEETVDENGEKKIVKKYYQYLRFPVKEHKNKFCEMVKQAIDTHAAAMNAMPIQNEEECPF